MAKATLMLSGGIDSVVLAHWAKNEGHEIELLFFDYGQDNLRKEMACARATSLVLESPLEVFDLSGLRRNFIGLTGPTYRMISVNKRQIKGHGGSDCRDKAVGLGIAAEWTVITNRTLLFVGTNAEDKKSSPKIDKFLESSAKSINYLYEDEEQEQAIEISAPFITKSKAEIIQLGSSLKVNFSYSWSCTSSDVTPCLKCAACNQRKNGFSTAKIADPLM